MSVKGNQGNNVIKDKVLGFRCTGDYKDIWEKGSN